MDMLEHATQLPSLADDAGPARASSGTTRTATTPRPRRFRRLAWQLARHLVAGASSLLATAVTFYFVSLLNAEQSGSSKRTQSALTRFDVDQAPKRRRPESRSRVREPRRVKKRVAHNTDPRALIPNLASRIGSQGLNVATSDDGQGPMVGASMARVTNSRRRGSLQQGVFEAGDVQKPAAVRSRASPMYPRAAIKAGISGYVRFKLLIDERGDVQRIVIDRAEPKGVFEAAALQSMQQWAFEPARHEGLAVSSWVYQTIRFALK